MTSKLPKYIIIGLCIVLLVLSGCGTRPYTDGTCGSLCIQKECKKEGADCAINPLGEILSPSPEASEVCINLCYDNQKK